jgi:hypothetical protein
VFNKNNYSLIQEGFLIDFIQKLLLDLVLLNWVILGSQKLNFSFINKVFISFILLLLLKPISSLNSYCDYSNMLPLILVLATTFIFINIFIFIFYI